VIDTHAHLDMCEPADEELVAAARDAGVTRILAVGMRQESNLAAIAAADLFEEVYASIGRHPNEASGYDEEAAADIEALATTHAKVRAIGETGLDYHRDHATPEDQRRAFLSQLEIARRAELPLVIHMRDAAEETYDVLRAEADGIPVVMHCFSSPERLDQVVGEGWFVSFAGNVTYPSARELQEAARQVPPELLLVETDSPYLAPQVVRGKPNQPANVEATARFVAELRGISYEELDRTVEENAVRLFGW
jgi:TatD DNase family protein